MKKLDFFCIFIFLVAIISITPRIDNYKLSYLARKGVVEKDILFKTIGEAKALLSEFSYITADIYFHGGLGSYTEEDRCITHRDLDEQRHEHKESHFVAPGYNVLAKLAEKINLNEHRHLSGMESKETLPWFYYAVKLNPRNIKAYTLGGYWAGSKLDRPDEGIKFLKEGLRYNPDSWEICSEIANLYFRKKKDYGKAILYYERARSFFTEGAPDKYERRMILTFLGMCYEGAGEKQRAVEIYREILKYFSANKTLVNKIEQLTSGK